MPPKVSKVSSKPIQTKTIAKASTSSSSKSSGSSKSSSTTSSKSTGSRSTTSTVMSAPPKPAPTPAPKPRNVDKVDFGKTKTTVSAGTYKPTPPKLTTKNLTTYQQPIVSSGSTFGYAYLLRSDGGSSSEPPKPKPKQEDYNPMQMDLKTRAKIKEAGHKYDKEHPEESDATIRLGATTTGAVIGGMAGGPIGVIAGAAAGRWGTEFVEGTLKDLGEVGEKVWEKTKEVIDDIFRETTMNMLDEDNPMG